MRHFPSLGIQKQLTVGDEKDSSVQMPKSCYAPPIHDPSPTLAPVINSSYTPRLTKEDLPGIVFLDWRKQTCCAALDTSRAMTVPRAVALASEWQPLRLNHLSLCY